MKDSKQETPQWLKTIQLNSWEAELLVSALILYALFQIPDYLSAMRFNNVSRDNVLAGLAFSTLQFALKFLQTGYILHIIIRGIWVASIGFSYVFPDGIMTEKLKFKGNFKKELTKSKSIVNNVLFLEKLSSIIFGLTFTFFGIVFGLGFLFFAFYLLMTFFSPFGSDPLVDSMAFFGVVSVIYILMIFMSLLDFLTSGLLRKKEWAIDWFYPIAKTMRVLTLSFLYRRSLLVLLSNVRGWKAKLIPILLGGLLFLGVQLNKGRNENLRNNYMEQVNQGAFLNANFENRRVDHDPLFTVIQSDIIDDSFLNVYLSDLGTFRQMKDSDFRSDELKWFDFSADSCSFYLNKWMTFKVDETEFHKIEWVKVKDSKKLDYGFEAILDLGNLQKGKHRFTISFDTEKMSKKELNRINDKGYNRPYFANIPFYYNLK